MAKKVEYINLMGGRFKLINGCTKPQTRYNDIKDAYDKPSVYKVSIWESWKRSFLEDSTLPSDYIGISSRNVFMFTICGVITLDSGTKYGFYITKTRMDAWYL